MPGVTLWGQEGRGFSLLCTNVNEELRLLLTGECVLRRLPPSSAIACALEIARRGQRGCCWLGRARMAAQLGDLLHRAGYCLETLSSSEKQKRGALGTVSLSCSALSSGGQQLPSDFGFAIGQLRPIWRIPPRARDEADDAPREAEMESWLC